MGLCEPLQALKLNFSEFLNLRGKLFYTCVDKHTELCLCKRQLPADVRGLFLAHGYQNLCRELLLIL